ncbi:N-acetylmuramoyl-L-alanine amidase [Novosphingobium colocasiae]|uniref:N-acetylmuramoyl-L-alanine amidase family protein n=1 Tax=Novosphingobium colocasiae TaxID=1256513 RepID=UPI0035AE7A1F
MSRRLSLFAVLATPLAVLALVFAVNRDFWMAKDGDGYVIRFDMPSVDAPVDLPDVEGPADSSRPLVVIDAGHGGFDPGAGNAGLREKDVALGVALAVRDRLVEDGGIRVALTRDNDRFIALSDRPDIARRLNADLFVSIHADSAENDTARGASVYVLSEKGSSEAAQRIAARENGAGQVNGVPLANNDAAVGAILLDLSQRNAQAGSAQMGRLLLRELQGNVGLHRDTVQTAALAVLKAPDIPSILFETGYINNADDARILTSRAGRAQIADDLARAIRVFFARKAGA